MKKILISGGTGLVGEHLSKLLTEKGHIVTILSRKPTKENEFKWDIAKNYIDENAFKDITHIIHLAGAGIADKRWTTRRKKELIDSRVQSAELLYTKVKELKIPLQGFITASGIGFYGAITSNKIFTENDTSASDFIAEICVKWENKASLFKQMHIPTTILRTGIVLAKAGALKKMNTPLFLSVLGTGNQYMPWIHIDDLCNLYIKAVENPNFTGIFNAVAPNHQTNKSFTKTLGKVVNKWITPINVPNFVLKVILGEMSTILINGSRISATKTAQFYKYKFTDLKTAMRSFF